MFSRSLLLSLFHRAYRNFSRKQRVNPALTVVLERWPFLHYLVANQAKRAVLSEFGDLHHR